MKPSPLLILLLLVSCHVTGVAMRCISTAEGISNKQTYSVLTDSRGFLWITTRNGVDRCDGTQVRTYRLLNSRGDDLAGRTNSAVLAPDGTPWVYTNSGDIFRYDIYEDSYKHLASLQDSLRNTNIYVNSLAFADSATLIICHSEGALRVRLSSAIIDTICCLKNNNVIAVCPIDMGRFAVATGSGVSVCQFDVTDSVFYTLPLTERVQSLLYDNLTERLYCGTFNGDLYAFDNPTQHLSLLLQTGACIRHIVHYDHSLYLATDGQGIKHVAISEPRTDFYVRLKSELADAPAFAYNIHINDGRLWVTTHGGGLYCFDSNNPSFRTITSPFPANDEQDNSLNTIFEDHNGNLWIGGNQGLCRINESTGEKTFVPYESGKSGNDNNIIALCEDRFGNIWAGGGEDYSCIAVDAVTCKPKKPLLFLHDKTPARLYALFSDSRGYIWAGGFGYHLTCYDPLSGKSCQYPVKYVNCITESADAVIAGTTNGLYSVNPVDSTVVSLLDGLGLSANLRCINHIYPASDGVLWLSTEGGLIRFLPSTRSLQVFSTEIGLLSNSIYAALPDAKDRLWLSTNRGVQCFEPKNRQLLTFTETEGLPDENFKNRFFLRRHSGVLFFGTASKMVEFDPERIAPADAATHIVLTSLSVDGETEKCFVVNERSRISVLSGFGHSFSLGVACINFSIPRRTRTEWLLSGVDAEWHKGEQGVIAYSHLRPGRYNLRLRAINTLTGAVLAERNITVVARPSVIATSLFFLFFVVLGILVTLVIIRRRERRIKKTETDEKTVPFAVTSFSTVAPDVMTAIPLDNVFIEKVSRLLDANIDNSEYTIDQLASDMAMSRSSFFTKLKAISGIGPNEFIRTYRMNHAAELLREGGYSVMEAAYASGFNDVKYFSTVFKKQFGVSPSKYCK